MAGLEPGHGEHEHEHEHEHEEVSNKERQAVQLPLAVRAYVVAISGAAALALAGWSAAWPGGLTLATDTVAGVLLPLAFALLKAATLLFPLHLSRAHKVTVGDAVLFAGLLVFGAPLAMAAIGTGAAAGYLVMIAGRKRNLWDLLFNTSKSMLSVGAGGAVCYLVATARGSLALDDPMHIVSLPVVALVMYLFNTFPTSIAIWLQHKKSPFQTWMRGRRIDALQSVALYLIGLVAALTVQEHPWSVVVMALPTVPIYVTLKRSVELSELLAAHRRDDHTVSAVEAMADTVDLRNPYTHGHSRRVATYAMAIARELRLPESEIELIRMAARVHDLGKLGVPDHVLRKPGRLNADEWDLVEKHVQAGYDILSGFPEYRECLELVRRHHERWDGSGYPQAIAGTGGDAPLALGAQVLSIADALDAMTTERPYRPALTRAQVLHELSTHKGQQWHPGVVAALERLLESAAETGHRTSGGPVLPATLAMPAA